MRAIVSLLAASAALLLAAPASAQLVRVLPAEQIAPAQISVGTTATLVAAARNRSRVIVNVGAANSCSFGNAGVTASTGFPLQPVAGATLTLSYKGALYAVCSATTTIGVIEEY